jgi:hypothetical protein
MSLRLAPYIVRGRAEFGLLAIRRGRTDEGLTRLREAAERHPDDPGIVGKLAKGLRLAGKTAEARKTLRAALFRNSRTPRFRKLWSEFQIESLRRREAARMGHRGNAEDAPVILPFVRVVPAAPAAEVNPTILRTDDGPRPRRSDQRNVQ